MCTRVKYTGLNGDIVVGRNMDWPEDMGTDLWAFPRGMVRDGGLGPGSLSWVSRYGSVIASIYDAGSSDGINEAGLAVNILALPDTIYPSAEGPGQPLLSIGAWVQWTLDNFATVAEAVDGHRKERFRIVTAVLPSGINGLGHLSLSDTSGDSAIIEFLDGRMVIHHGSQYNVMTNAPSYDQQLAINAYWESVGGLCALPGTVRATDRFARASFFLCASPKVEDPRKAVASVFFIMRAVGSPLGMAVPGAPELSATIWRTVIDHARLRYYFENTLSPNVFWVDVANIDLSNGATPLRLDLDGHPVLAGEVSGHFVQSKPFAWLTP